MADRIKAYKKEYDYSYTSGASPTFELIRTRPDLAQRVYVHSQYREQDGLEALCKANGVPVIHSDKAFGILNQKENSYVLGVFKKYGGSLRDDKPHVVLVNPSDMGNLGTIMRTMAGFGLKDLAVIEPAADIWNPKTVRASMGALFSIRHQCFPDFGSYARSYPGHAFFPFMLTGTSPPEEAAGCPLFSLIFGNEASGLDEGFSRIGRSVRIPLTGEVDSFNLAVAVGIGAYVFAREAGRAGAASVRQA